jgi:Transcription factor WhiB
MAPPRIMRLAGRADGPLPAVSPADHTAPVAGRFTGPALWALVIRHARCSDSGLDPDQWFPVSADTGRARLEAAAAIAICATCPVRGHCLTLSLRHWDIGQHGVWGGLIAADRARLRHRASGVAESRGRPSVSSATGGIAPSVR